MQDLSTKVEQKMKMNSKPETTEKINNAKFEAINKSMKENERKVKAELIRKIEDEVQNVLKQQNKIKSTLETSIAEQVEGLTTFQKEQYAQILSEFKRHGRTQDLKVVKLTKQNNTLVKNSSTKSLKRVDTTASLHSQKLSQAKLEIDKLVAGKIEEEEETLVSRLTGKKLSTHGLGLNPDVLQLPALGSSRSSRDVDSIMPAIRTQRYGSQVNTPMKQRNLRDSDLSNISLYQTLTNRNKGKRAHNITDISIDEKSEYPQNKKKQRFRGKSIADIVFNN